MQHQPHPHVPPNDGDNTQYSTPINDSKPLDKEGKKIIMQLTGTFLYYDRVVDGTMLKVLISIDLKQSAPTESTMKKCKKFLN